MMAETVIRPEDVTPRFRLARAQEILALQGFTKNTDRVWYSPDTIATITEEHTVEFQPWTDKVKPGYQIRYQSRKDALGAA